MCGFARLGPHLAGSKFGSSLHALRAPTSSSNIAIRGRVTSWSSTELVVRERGSVAVMTTIDGGDAGGVRATTTMMTTMTEAQERSGRRNRTLTT